MSGKNRRARALEIADELIQVMLDARRLSLYMAARDIRIALTDPNRTAREALMDAAPVLVGLRRAIVQTDFYVLAADADLGRVNRRFDALLDELQRLLNDGTADRGD